jgi:hypothetical protein
MLVLSLLTSAAVAVVLGLVVYLFVGGYSGGNSPTSVTPALFPIAHPALRRRRAAVHAALWSHVGRLLAVDAPP